MKLFCLTIGVFLSQLAWSQWDQYLALWDDKPGSMLVDLDYMEMIDSTQLPYLLGVGHQFAPCSTDGFPDTLVYEQLYKLSDKLHSYMDIQSTCKLVGTFTHNCQQVDYYYLKDTLGIRSFLDNYFLNEDSGFTSIISITHDPDNQHYTDVIFPDVYITEYRQNTSTIQSLINQGDDINHCTRGLQNKRHSVPKCPQM